MTDALDVAKHHLESVRAYAQMRVDYLKAIGDYNLKMMEVLEKQVKVETDREKLKQLKAAHEEYKEAIREIKKRARTAESEEAKLDKAAVKANRLKWGEMLDADLVTTSWQGFQVVVDALRGADSRKVFQLKIAAKHRKGDNFARPRYPNKSCDDAPGNIKAALSLFRWCRKKQYVPVMGSNAAEKLHELYETIETATQTRLDELSAELLGTREELLALRKEKWQNVNALHGVKKE